MALERGDNLAKVSEIYKDDLREKSELLKSMANPIRLCILNNLRKSGELNVTDFVNCMDASQSNISQHLARLRRSEIIGFRKEGLKVIYYIKNQRVVDMLNIIFMDDN